MAASHSVDPVQLEARNDRFFALWVLEATTGMRRSELAGAHRDGIDFDIGTLTVGSTRVVIDGKVIEEDGKSDNSRRTIALDPYTLGGHTSVSFTMETYMLGDLEADREVAHALASVILAGIPGRVSPGETV